MKFYTVYDLQCYFSPKLTQKSAGDYFRDMVKAPIFLLKKSHSKCDFVVSKYYVMTYMCHHMEYFFSEPFLVC